MTTQAEFLDFARTKVGRPYISDANRFGPDHYDCSGLVWACCKHFNIPFGTTTVSQLQWGIDHHSRVEPNVAANTAGGLLIRGGLTGYGPHGHVVICVGDGIHTIEAKGTAFGVVEGDLRGRTFQDGVLIPGLEWAVGRKPLQTIDVNPLAKMLADAKKRILKRGAGIPDPDLAVTFLQKALTDEGFPLIVDGQFGAATETQVRAFQGARGLLVDGEVGRDTWAALIP